jgi:hypothetical protein
MPGSSVHHLMKKIISFVSLLLCLQSYGQADSAQKVIGLNIHYGQVYIHSVAVRNVKGSMPAGVEVELSRQKTMQTVYEQCNCYPKTGFQLTYIYFGTAILGHGIAVSRFIEPRYRISDRWQFALKASIGAIYLSKPYRADKNPENHSYSAYINPYFNLGTALSFSIDRHLAISAMGFFHHTSNSGIRQPNRGINWFTGMLSLQYYSHSTKLPRFKRSYNRYWKKLPVRFEAGILYSPKQDYNSRLQIERKYFLGGFVQAMKQVGRTSSLVAGTEIYYTKFLQSPKPVNTSVIIGIQAGHVFLLGKMSFSQQIGVDVLNKTVTKTSYYTKWGFNYRFGKHIKLGAALKAQADYADFADLQLSYLF